MNSPACSVACKMENDVDLGVFRTRVYRMGPVGQWPDNLEMFFFPNGCMHCEEPSCIDVCPTKATYKTDEGVVLVDANRCFGCQYCIWACPYEARTLNPHTKVVEKCTLCKNRIDQGELPTCVEACVGKARFFGDLDDPASEVAQLIASGETVQILADAGTEPSVFYLK